MKDKVAASRVLFGRLCCLLAPAAFALDRISKPLAREALKGRPAAEIWPGMLRLVYVENTGAAFGVLQGRQTLLLLITGVALTALLVWLVLKGRTLPAFAKASLWLLLGGALGNFVDRLLYGYVIDFIEIRLFSFPVFNVADCCVCVAFALLAGFILFGKTQEKA